MAEREEVVVRPLLRYEEFEDAVKVQELAWGMPEIERVPAHVLIAAAKNGGVVLGAFEPSSGRLIGFVFGFTGLGPEGPYHYSHMMGVVPEWQGRGVGFRLKMAQREAALSRGLRLIEWTFDPLQRGNSRLNLGKLGVVIRTYVRSYYGEMLDEVNRGIPSDRVVAEWFLDSERVRAITAAERPPPTPGELLDRGAVVCLDSRPEGDRLRRPRVLGVRSKAELALVEIPWSVSEYRREGRLDLLREWRAATAEVFEKLMGLGFLDVDLAQDRKRRRCFHVFVRASLEEVLSSAPWW
ncbi:MAG: GNAT family N-acetyltransferase [Candidatus Korarchaeota archaeon]|nr:GNAT family N-acetyltransferase [Candidatus Korarchaeota archaeon]